MFRYKDGDPKPQSTASDADDAARSFGFENFADYQRAREICLGLLSQPLSPGINSCGNDMACMEQEAERLQRNMDSITSSNEWKRNKCDVVAEIEAEKDDDSYTIEISHNDEIFVINGETYEAKTYCFNMDEGDEVIFIDGSPYGACASAEVLNIRTKDRCELWCE